MKIRTRLLPFLLLAFALLFAQQGAAIHALSHLNGPQSNHSQQDKQLPHSPACDKCVVYAGVGAALASGAMAIPAAAAPTPRLAITPPVPLTQPARLYHARAPPSLV